MTRDISPIQEEEYSLAEVPWRLEDLGFDDLHEDSRTDPELRVWCLFIDRGALRDVLDSRISSWDRSTRSTSRFRETLAAWNPTSLLECAAALDYHGLTSRLGPPRHVETRYSDDEDLSQFLSDVLSSSRGLMIWHWQVEAVLGLFTRNAARVRQDLYTRKSTAWRFLEETLVGPDLCLGNLFRRLMPFDFTTSMNIQGARSLWRFLRE